MKNKTAIILISFVLLLGTAGIVFANNGLGFLRDMIVEKTPNSTAINKVDIRDKAEVGKYIIEHTGLIEDDGSLLFTVKDNNTGESLGEFPFKPWVSKNPLFISLPNDNVVLGDCCILNSTANSIVPLGGANLSIFDYSNWGDYLAYLGKSNDENTISLYVENLITGQTNVVDTFSYPENQYPDKLVMSYGLDGILYYDACEAGKPIIKTYTGNDGKPHQFINGAMHPQVSPDGSKLVILLIDSMQSINRAQSELVLMDISTASKLVTLSGSDRIFWVNNYLVNKDVDMSLLNFYDLSNGGKKVKEVSLHDLPYQITSNNGTISVKCYRFENNTVTNVKVDVKL